MILSFGSNLKFINKSDLHLFKCHLCGPYNVQSIPDSFNWFTKLINANVDPPLSENPVIIFIFG